MNDPSKYCRDFFGREIQLGTWILYPVRQGSHMAFRCGFVEELGGEPINASDVPGNVTSWDGWVKVSKQPGGRTWMVDCLERAFVLPEGYEIKRVVTNEEYGWAEYQLFKPDGTKVRTMR